MNKSGRRPPEKALNVHPAELDPDQLLAACTVRRQRRSGPGGQHRNKVETGIVLVYPPTGTRAEATERRSQHANRQVAVARLRVNLAIEVRQQRSPEDVPSARWADRLNARRLAVSRDHPDFPGLLAEALDVVFECGHDLRAAAARLQLTPSQLVRFLKLDPRALEQVNRHRQARNLHRLK